MTTFDLLLAYLQTHRNESDIVLNNYELNGSIIKLTYSYNPNFSWDKEFIDYGNIIIRVLGHKLFELVTEKPKPILTKEGP